MLKCIIIDDEQLARRLLENYCSKIDTLEVLGSYKSAIKALPTLNSQNVDILFLDIQMPDINGIDFLKSIKTYTTKVIFTTAYREYALDGFELDAIDYLVKPIEFPRFLRAVEKVKEVHQKRQEIVVKDVEKMLIIKADKKQYRIPISEIMYVKSENEYVNYVTKNHGNLLVHGALKDVVALLSGSTNFFRIHRSHIVNLSYITYTEGGRVKIQDEFLPISESYKVDFFKVWK
ncbi:LytTR family DNA-binding domain-containing protein [Tenacibaculum sp. 190524A02b]|uniref:LytR/AlgR family response regulator transcription factor n=1 Tax=Tenacibaculum vairaonense TaxID=3137860 RepID=UPI0031FA8633